MLLMRTAGAILLFAALVVLVVDADRFVVADSLASWSGGRSFVTLADFSNLVMPGLLPAEVSRSWTLVLQIPAVVLFAFLATPLIVLSGRQRVDPLQSETRLDKLAATPVPSGASPSGKMDHRPGAKAQKTAPAPSLGSLNSVEREFLPAALELLETPPSPVRIAAMMLICAAAATALAWSYFGKLDIHAVAEGRILPSGRSKVVQSLEPGKVVSIGVENGSRIAAGFALLELDPTETRADRQELGRELDSARAEAARRSVAVAVAASGDLEPRPIEFAADTDEHVRQREERLLAAELGQLRSNMASLKAQLEEHAAAEDRLTASIAERERLLALSQERVDMRTKLNDENALSRALVIESLQQHETEKTVQVGEQGQLVETKASLRTLLRKIEEATSQFIADQTEKLSAAERKVDGLTQELIKAKSKNERTTIRSPIAGTVQQLAVTTVGQVVSSGQPLMTIVPAEGPIEIEVMIQNQDIGFVEPGQPAVIKVESFPFTRFGTVDGRVMKVSRDAVDEREANALLDPTSAVRSQGQASAGNSAQGQNLVFPATISLNRWTINIDGKDIPLSPGMAVTVEIRTGERRVIDYVLSPLREVTSSSGHER